MRPAAAIPQDAIVWEFPPTCRRIPPDVAGDKGESVPGGRPGIGQVWTGVEAKRWDVISAAESRNRCGGALDRAILRR